MSEVNWQLGHLNHLGSPWGNAGGVVKSVEDVERMAKTGVGWIEAGSYCMEERFGNDRDKETGEFIIDPDTGNPIVVYYHDPGTGESYNSLGMPGKGIDKVEQEIPEMIEIAHRHYKKLIVNVAPVSNDPTTESFELVTRAFEAKADGVILNGGCPNVWDEDGDIHEILSTNPAALARVLLGLRPVVERFMPIYLRLSPLPTYDQTKTVLRIVEASKAVSVVFIPNSFNQKIPFKNGKKVLGIEGDTAGKTGPATAEDTYRQAVWAKEILRGSKVGIVRSGGIANWEAHGIKASEELRRTLSLGALAAGTTFYYESVDWPEDTHRLLEGALV